VAATTPILRKINKTAVTCLNQIKLLRRWILDKSLNSQPEKAEQSRHNQKFNSLKHDKKLAEIKVQKKPASQPAPVIKKISAVSADNSTNKSTST
jgi:translation initiation factor 2B subunit (eIF-2B alpha/beta/delta family)